MGCSKNFCGSARWNLWCMLLAAGRAVRRKSDQAAIAPAFRFLRQPSRPNAPRPETKDERAAGSGTAETV